MNRLKTLTFLLLFVPFMTMGQTNSIYNDTAYFIPFDNDFNLIMSASKGHTANVINLIERKANINAITVDGISSLMYATENGDLEMVKLLIEKGASPDLKPYNGVTALISACQLNYYTIAEYLVSNGAKINESDLEGVSPLHYAAAYNYADILEMLLFYGADLKKSDRQGNSPLITASYNNSIESVKILLEKGAPIDAKDKQGYTALMVACQENNMEIVDILLENKAEINASNDGGMTALGFAIASENYKLTEKLIRNGADINQRISLSQNMLELAKESKDDNITELLITEGANSNLYPSFKKMSLGPGFLFCSKDFMMGIDYNLLDTKYNTAIKSGFYLRPGPIRINTEPINDTLYQYWERRYGIHVGLEKKINLVDSKKSETGPFLGVNALYSFGSYRGSNSGPDGSILFNPFIGWYYMTKYISLSAQYEYLDLAIPEFNNGRIKIALGFNISSSRKKLSSKTIDWLSE